MHFDAVPTSSTTNEDTHGFSWVQVQVALGDNHHSALDSVFVPEPESSSFLLQFTDQVP